MSCTCGYIDKNSPTLNRDSARGTLECIIEQKREELEGLQALLDILLFEQMGEATEERLWKLFKSGI